MSIRPLIEESEVAEAFATFSSSVVKGGEAVNRLVGYQGGSEEATLIWHTDKKLWVLLEPERIANRFWCAFGTQNPLPVSMVSITCEINPPRLGINRRCAGLFIRDSANLTYLAHSGKVGGGREGIGKTAFTSSRDSNDVVTVKFPDGGEHDYIVIGRLDDSTFLDDLAKFVHSVEGFKQTTVRSGG